jgi:arylsulfatase A-like enzyme
MPRPFFAYLHFLPPHDPYNPRREFVGMFDDGWAPPAKPMHPLSDGVSEASLNEERRHYDENIAYVDSEFGRFHQFMEESGLLDTTYLMVTSDHGELFERGVLKHITPVLFEPVIRVPLLVSAPGQQTRVDVQTPTSSVDIVPTLLRIAGLEKPIWCEGEVLPSLGGDVGFSRNIYALEAKMSERNGQLNIHSLALLTDRYKLVRYRGYDKYPDAYEMYDLSDDPEELNNIYQARPEVARDLSAIMAEQWIRTVGSSV